MRYFTAAMVVIAVISSTGSAADPGQSASGKKTGSRPSRDPRLLTIDQAVSISERTGRPIFAVAGSAT